jgi:raffinose/stachyose/melibiose transport system permease protein
VSASVKGLGLRGVYYTILGGAAILGLVPTLWVMVSSFKTTGQILSGDGLLPHPVSFQGYVDVFKEVHLHEYVLNSLMYAVGATVGSLFVGLLAAYPIARFEFRGRNVLGAAFSLCLAIPVVGMATPEFFVIKELGLIDSRLGIIVFYSALNFPLAFVILRAYLVSLPAEVEEAALLDGAGYFTIVRRIVLPLARPALATVAIVVFVATWNEFFFVNMLVQSDGFRSVQQVLSEFRGRYDFNAAGALAGATIVMLVPIAVFLALQRQVIAGLTAGASK